MVSTPTRRAFLTDAGLILTAGLCAPAVGAGAPKPLVRLGLLTDLHYADKPSGGTRHYRKSLDKLAVAATQFAADKPDAIIELGDLIDAAPSVAVEKTYLARIARDFIALSKKRHCVLGNHCVDILTKQEFLDGVEQKASHYSFDLGGVHFVILDACFRKDGTPYGRKKGKWDDANIPAAQVRWLADDLAKTTHKVIVFAHQRIDSGPPYGIGNAVEVRKTLETSGKVLAVFQGHSHANDLKQIGDISYCTLRAMVDGEKVTESGHSVLDVLPGDTLRLSGFALQKSHTLTRKRS